MGVGREGTDFAEFYKASWTPCLRAVSASVADPRLAEDLVAEAFARAWGSWRDVSRHPAPRAWVVRTALNASVSWWRRHHREVALGAQDPAGRDPAGFGGGTGPGEGVDTALLEAVRRLPAREREVIALRLILDLDTETTAKQLGIAPGTVRAHLSRAMVALRQETVLTAVVEVSPCTTTPR
jgi:DNA-directed RNA polymerase specialized sigma24 family protein